MLGVGRLAGGAWKPNGPAMSFSEYFNAQAYHVAQIARLPVFTDLIVPLDDLYRLSVQLVPSASKPYYGRLLLLCHKAFMSAASSIARGQPDDSHGVSRRACEAARIARAIKYKADNLKAWQAYDERLARWEARRRNERPKTLRRPDIQDPPGNEFVSQLLARIGTYSDASVHFTPEFMTTQAWRHEGGSETGTVKLRYFEPSQTEIELAFADLAATHVIILRTFDECYERAFVKNREWVDRLHGVCEVGLTFFPKRPPSEGTE
jgi:hypothetical protein